MTLYIGRKIMAGIAKEAVRGTAEAAAEFWLYPTNIPHEQKVETVEDNSAQGTMVNAQSTEVVKAWGEGGIEALITSEGIGLIMLCVIGDVNSATKQGETGVYTHTYELLEEAQHPSMTLFIDQPNGDTIFPMFTPQSLGLTFESGKILDMKLPGMSKKSADGSLTPAFTEETKFRPQDVAIKIAADLAGLGAAAVVDNLKSLELTIEKNLESYEALGFVDPVDFLAKEFSVEGSIVVKYDNNDLQDLVFNTDYKALRITIENADVTIGSASHPSIVIDLAKVAFKEISTARGLGDVVEQTIKFKALYSQDDAKFGNVVITNTTVSY